MIINTVGPHSLFSSKLTISKNVTESDRSWVTVIVGENGTKKSLLLRFIALEVAYGYRVRSRLECSGVVSKLIVLSGTPHDRFPRLQRRPLLKYSYFGLKAVNNVIGVGHSERTLIQALISNRNKIKNRKHEFELVFGQLGLEARVKAEFQINRKYDFSSLAVEDYKSSTMKIIARFESYVKIMPDLPGANSQDRRDSAAALKFILNPAQKKHLLDVLNRLAQKSFTTTLTSTGNYVSANTFPIAIWRVLLDAGIVDFRRVWFEPKEDAVALWGTERIPGSYLSSGQWSWLCTLGGLVAEVDDDSVILIDEPENSLHPAWQRDYIPTLMSILEKVHRCHVVLATHAPLVASGLPPSGGNVRRLKREISTDGNQAIHSYEAPNTFGWSASDAFEALFQLETTRSKIFNVAAEKALAIIRDKKDPEAEKNRLIQSLSDYSESLPALDPMRSVMESIATSLKNINLN